MSASLPVRPHLDWYRKAAKKKLAELRNSNPTVKLSDAQFALARDLEFSSWRDLKKQIDALDSAKYLALASTFVRFADTECRGVSPLYEQLSRAIAQDRELLAVAALGKTPIPNLMFAAVQYLLMKQPNDPLARYYASLFPNASSDESTFRVFKAFVLQHRVEILGLFRRRYVQTNEVARCGYLRLAFGVANDLLGNRPASLIEVGASAGLNLCFDRYAYDYGDGNWVGNAKSAVRIRSEARGVGIDKNVRDLAIHERVGIDLNPITPDDADEINWLIALIWPEHHERRATLRSAIELSRKVNIRRVKGDALVELPRVLASVPRGTSPLVFQTHTLNQFSPEARTQFTGVIANYGKNADIAFVSRHDKLTLDHYSPAGHRSYTLATTDGHGRWFEWLDASVLNQVKKPDVNVPHVFRDVMKAIVARDVVRVKELLATAPAVVNLTGPHPNWGGRPQPLHVSIECDAREVFDLLLELGANPSGDNSTYDGWSPLMLSVHWKRAWARDGLLSRGAKVGLIEALMLGNDARAFALIDSDPTLLTTDIPNNATPLHFARTESAARRLLDAGVDPTVRDKYGKTALDVASENGLKPVMDVLMKSGADASPMTFARAGDLARLKKALAGQKPDAPMLKVAIQGKHEAVVKWLLTQDIDVHERDTHGGTLLHTAAWEGNLNVAKMLVKAGADVHAEDDEHGATPAGWAQHAGDVLNRVECAEVSAFLEKQMAKKWSVKALPEARQTHKVAQWKPIMDAAFDGDSTRIRKLVKEGADVNATSTTPGAHRPLHRAIEEKKTSPRGAKHEAAVKTLLELGADPKRRGTGDRLTALQLAAIQSPRFVPILMDAFTPLDFFHACVLLDEKRVETLLKKDRSLATARDVNGFTGLHYVAASRVNTTSEKHQRAQLNIASKLIDAGADVNATYIWLGGGDWPISVLYQSCGRNNNPDLTELLMKAGALPYDNESVYHASDEGHDACLAVIEKYADKQKLADEATMCLRTQMHWGKSRGMKWLLQHGADPNSLHPQCGNSALHNAVKHGARESVVKLLLTHGANPQLPNRDGKLAIDLAKPGKAPALRKLLGSAS